MSSKALQDIRHFLQHPALFFRTHLFALRPMLPQEPAYRWCSSPFLLSLLLSDYAGTSLEFSRGTLWILRAFVVVSIGKCSHLGRKNPICGRDFPGIASQVAMNYGGGISLDRFND